MPRTYVNNAYNRSVGRVGMPVGSCVISRGSSGSSSGASSWSSGLSSMTASASTSGAARTYVDNSFNRQHDRVGLPLGSKPVSKDSSPTSSAYNTYVDNSFNRQHGRVGLPIGSKPVSKDSSSSSKGSSHSDVLASERKVYADNPINRRLGRVGQPIGNMIYSKNTQSGRSSNVAPSKTYADNPLNRSLGRVGKPLGSQPHSSKTTHTKKIKEMVEKIQTDDQELYGVDGTHAEKVYDVANVSPDSAIEEAIWYINRKLEEIRWHPESKTDETPSTAESVIKDYAGEKIDFWEIDLGKPIGHGGFGEVFCATWKGTTVAVKKLKVQAVSKRRLKEFSDEVIKFCHLDHPNIVKFIGASVVVPNLAIVMEFMQSNLFDVLHMDDEVEFSEKARLSIMRQITCGLLYLHENNIAHCDLKSPNVLLNDTADDEVVAKITDFGLSMVRNDAETSQSKSTEEMVRNVGTPRYSAPEVLRGELLTAEAMMRTDIYSLALIFYEVLLEEEPFYNLSYAQLQKQVGDGGKTPDIPEDTSIDEKLEKLIRSCWNFDPAKRPDAKEVFEGLKV